MEENNLNVLNSNKLLRHYSYKLATNFLRIPISFALQAIFPRILNPIDYGNFDFLTDFSNKIINFLDNGASIAFYSKLSQKNNDKILVKYFIFLLLVISFIYFSFTFLSIKFENAKYIWPGQQNIYILISCFLGILTLFSNTLLKMVDAYDLTVQGEKFRMLQLCFSLMLFFITYILFQNIRLYNFYILQLLIILFLIVGSIYIIKNDNNVPNNNEKLTKIQIQKYTKEFWLFSNPLMLYSLIAMLSGIFERWLLQKFGGSIQQAYFGISFKIGAFIFLFSSAMIPLLMREFSKLYLYTEIDKISKMFLKNVKILFFISCFLGVFVAFNSNLITEILTGGIKYNQAVIVVTIMAFYPIHQTLGQMNATLFFSTNRTSQYRNVGLIFLPIGTLLCFFFVAPKNLFCLELGAKGLAIYMLILQFLSVNTSLFLNCKYLQIPFLNLLTFQTKILLLLIGISYLIKFLLLKFTLNTYIITSLHFFFLFIIVATIISLRPSIIGATKDNIHEIFKIFKFKL